MQARKQRGGGIAPRQKSRIGHEEEQGSEKKIEKGDTGNKRRTKKRKGRGKTENGKREKGKGKEKGGEKGKRTKEKRGQKLREVGVGVYRGAKMSGRHYANYVGLNGGDAS